MRLHIGMDDTDSARGMCTTFLAYVVADGLLARGDAFLDYPRLVRLNPNIPWKTRGNGAVSMTIETDDPDGAERFVTGMVRKHAETGHGANPGVVFLEGDSITPEMRRFSGEALRGVIPIGDARRLAREAGARVTHLGTGRGVVGALAAIGYGFVDSTAELITYRTDSMLGNPRRVSPETFRMMQEETYPDTFSSYDASTGKVLAAPRGPDPVFYGLRGEDPLTLCRASEMIPRTERLRGHLIFRTNQGTGDHLRHPIDVNAFEAHASGLLRGVVCDIPAVAVGGHASFRVAADGRTITCWAYRPTGLSGVVAGLIPGDRVLVGGGVRRASPVHPRTLNIELVRVLSLAPLVSHDNPRCSSCNKSMKSQGRGQGFACVRCGAVSGRRTTRMLPRSIRAGEYIPKVSAHRHLTRPLQRAGRTNRMRFDGTIPWFSVYVE